VGTGNKNSWLAIIDTGMIVFEVGNRSKKVIIE
jgi:ribosomal protein L16/L10AE